jgi:ketol-acid reductoisomerase
MVRVFYDKDISLDSIKDKTIAIIGYGNQGRNQALNLRDSGIEVIIGVRQGESWELALKENFKVYSIDEASKIGDIIHILIPDTAQPEVYDKYIAPNLSENKMLCFSHGFNIHFKQIIPPSNIDVIMVF